ncbi:MAG: SufE family protein [Thermodesulfobacteriota bacterium]|nr:SufE family protein [Thermodesulfobacteriota bacterium]
MTIDEAQDQIVSDMASREEWFDKYEYLVEQGKNLEALDDRFKVEAHVIQGCQSKVWVCAECIEGKVQYGADSDALITRGLIALLLRVLNHKVPEDIVKADLYFIQETGLGSHLSPSRANGLVAIVRQMKRWAENCAKK